MSSPEISPSLAVNISQGSRILPMKNSLFSPFTTRFFLAIWIATLVSNFGMQIHTMAAGWLMLRLDPSPQMVALVQVAASLPYMFFALLAGALSDIYDKRKIMLVAQLFSVSAAAAMAYMTYCELISPWSLLLFVLLIAIGASFFHPTWAASVREMVPRKYLPEAISLNAINFNLGRSFAPALGGLLITVFGIAWAFILNTLSYLGVVAILWRWKPAANEEQQDREPVFWALRVGVGYALQTDYIRVVILRILLCSIGAGMFWALMPIIASEHLAGDAATFTLLLTGMGLGSVGGGLLITRARQILGIQRSSVIAQLSMVLCTVGVALTDNLIFCTVVISLLGMSWMIFIANMNVSIQMSAPAWVVGRMLAIFQSAILLGFAAAGLLWGWTATAFGLTITIVLAAAVILLSCVYAILKPMLNLDEVSTENANLPPMAAERRRTETGKSPIIVTVAYHVTHNNTTAFLDSMSRLRAVRLRLGAVNWSLQQEIENPERWVERFVGKNWEEQKRRPKRYSHHDNDIRLQAAAFDENHAPKYTYMVIRNPERIDNVPFTPLPPV